MILGLDPVLLAMILTIPVLISAFASTKIGEIIGKAAQKKNGRRKIILAAGWIGTFSYGSIWSISSHWGPTITLFYLLVTSSVFFVSSAFLCIAIRCFAYEETDNPDEITSVMGLAMLFEKIGSIFYFWLFPLAQSNLFSSLAQGIRIVGWSVSFCFIGLLSTVVAFGAKAAKEFSHGSTLQGTHDAPLPNSYKKSLNLLLWVTFIQTGLVGLCISMDFYVLVYYVFEGEIKSGAFWKGILSTQYALVGLLSIPVLVHLSHRIGKHKTLTLIFGLNCVNSVLKWPLFAPDNEHLLIIDAITGAWIWTAIGLLIPSILADLCYLVKKETSKMPNSYVVAKHNRALNIGTVVAILGSGIVINITGFDASLGGGQSHNSMEMMRVTLSLGSFVFSLLSMLLLIRNQSLPVFRAQKVMLR